jgi:hypothetical protein
MEIVIAITGLVIGGLITITTAMIVEYLRRPRLQLIIEDPPCDVAYPAGKPAQNTRYLRLKLRNKPLPRGAQWMQRAAALQCRGEITFHHLDDGQDIFGRVMPVRWSNSPEPVLSEVVDLRGVVQARIVDFAKLTPESRIDVYPGEEEILDVANRHDNDQDCYGNNNEQYFSSAPWRNPRWRLAAGRYLVKVVITSSGQKCVGIFRLVNDVPRTDFRLVQASSAELRKIS